MEGGIVRDLDVSKKFYKEHLNWVAAERSPPDAVVFDRHHVRRQP